MEKVESPLDVLSRAATMVQPCPAYSVNDIDSFESPNTISNGESKGCRTLAPEAPRAQPEQLTGKWRQEQRRAARLPEYRPRKTSKMALRSQSFSEQRRAGTAAAVIAPNDVTDPAANIAVHGKGTPQEYSDKQEAPIDMCLRSRQHPPYSRPSVIKSSETSPCSMSICDPVIDEHFRRSLGDDYMTLFKNNKQSAAPQLGPKPSTNNRPSSPTRFKPELYSTKGTDEATNIEGANLSVDAHFAKALGDTWRQIQTSRLKESQQPEKDKSNEVHDQFSEALVEDCKEIGTSKLEDTAKEQTTKIISKSGVII